MKNRIVKTVITLLTSTLLLGCNTLEVNKTESELTAQTIRNGIDFGNVEIYHSTSKEEFDRLTPILENRNGKIIIEVIDGTVLDDNGNGTNITGKYIKYDSDRFSKGDKVQTAFIYNPKTNSFDDVLYRIDTLMK